MRALRSCAQTLELLFLACMPQIPGLGRLRASKKNKLDVHACILNLLYRDNQMENRDDTEGLLTQPRGFRVADHKLKVATLAILLTVAALTTVAFRSTDPND